MDMGTCFSNLNFAGTCGKAWFLSLVEIMIIVALVVVFWQARKMIRDKQLGKDEGRE